MNNNPFTSAFSSIVQNKNQSGQVHSGNVQNQPQNVATWPNHGAPPSSSGYVPRPLHTCPNVWQAASVQANGPSYVAYPQLNASYPSYQPPPPNHLQQQPFIQAYPQSLYAAYHHPQHAFPSYGSQLPFPPPRPPAYNNSHSYSTYHPPTMQTSSSLIHCSACNKDLLNQAAYKAHCDTHIPCDHPGCTFTASRKVISAHYQSTHGEYSGSGYKEIDVEGKLFRVLCGTSPAEVTQWREERRNKFPTKAQIQSKQSNKEQLEIAGGIDMTKESGKKRPNQQQLQRRGGKDNRQENKRSKRDRDYYQPQPTSASKEHHVAVEGHDDQDTHSLNLAPSLANTNRQTIRNKRNNTADNDNSSNNNNSKLKKPEISGNLLGRLLAEDVVQSENLLLQSIRYLRQLYCQPTAAAKQQEDPLQPASLLVELISDVVQSPKEEVNEASNLLLQYYASDDEEDGECLEA